ncbi:hypothetical protein Tco_1322263 [Tanacetum coccineum]
MDVYYCHKTLNITRPNDTSQNWVYELFANRLLFGPIGLTGLRGVSLKVMGCMNFLEILKQPRGLAKKDQVFVRVLSALNEIVDLMPLAPSKLEQIVKERVLRVLAKEAQIVVYVENMLMLALWFILLNG